MLCQKLLDKQLLDELLDYLVTDYIDVEAQIVYTDIIKSNNLTANLVKLFL